MMNNKDAPIQIDLDQFKLYLNLPGQPALSLHFDSPSRRFYLCVIALVVKEMKENGGTASILLEKHREALALLNETVGKGAGSSSKKKLLSRIYKKWKSALPDLENAPLFKVIGRKKGYDDGAGMVYRFDHTTIDAWANLFEYKGSGEKVRLRFSAERLGVDLKDVAVLYGGPSDRDQGGAWDRFLEHLRSDVKGNIQEESEKGDSRASLREPGSIEFTGVDPEKSRSMDQGITSSFSDVGSEPISRENFQDWLEKQGGIEKIPLTTRLQIIAHLAMVPGDNQQEERQDKIGKTKDKISGMLMGSISASTGNDNLYMAPELKDGQPPSPRSEVYALGVLLFQVVVGDMSRSLGPDWEKAVSDHVLREDIAACVNLLPEKRLANPLELSERLRTQNERRGLLPQTTRTTLIQASPSQLQRPKKRLLYGAALAVILALVSLFVIYQQKTVRAEAEKRQAYETNLPKIKQLLDDEKYMDAYSLAKEMERIIPGDPTLTQYMRDATNTMDIETMPAGASVSYRPYSDVNSPWVDLGITPIKKAVIPVSMTRFRIEKEGYVERELVRPVVPRDSLGYMKFREISDPFQFNLYEKGRVPDGMVPVDGGRFKVPIKGVPNKPFTVDGPFFIDKVEVTNRAYKEFVDMGGYGDPRYWQEEFRKDGQVIPFAEAMNTFVDRTGRPGPATWESGSYPEGRGDYPVSGISWYEAAAYARFRDKTLPTIYHWARALFPKDEFFTPLTPCIIPQSNIERATVAPVGSYPGIGSSGAKDMAGNVREWCWNAAGEDRYCLGGWWQDPAYVVTDSCVASAWDRSQGNGVRCVLYPEDAPPSAAHLKPADLRFHDPYTIPPRSKESLETLKAMFAYEKGPLHPVVESRKTGGNGWTRETVTIDAAYDNERLIIHLDLPNRCKPPYKTVIYWPGASALYHPEFSRNFLWEPWDLIPENGRALISPVYTNCFERGGGKPIRGKKSRIQRRFDRLNDLRRTIDYLETRKDIDTRSLAFLGLCWGGIEGPRISPYEERIKTLILVSGAIYIPIALSKPEALTQAMTKVPVLMLNGKYDFIFPVKTHQKPLFDLISTPPEHKKHVIYDCGHLPLPRAPMMKEIFAWLDKYQGPVDCGKNAANGNSVAR